MFYSGAFHRGKEIGKGSWVRFGFVLLCMAMFLVGCGAGRMMVLEPAKGKAMKITSVSIKEEPPTVKIKKEDREKFKLMLVQALKSVCGIESTEENPDLVVEYKIIQYNPGSRTARWFWGGVGNAGEGSVTVDAMFLTRNGERVGHIQAVGKIQSGFFGGSFSHALKKAAEQIALYVKQYLQAE